MESRQGASPSLAGVELRLGCAYQKLLSWLGAKLFTEVDLAQSAQASLLRACYWQNVNLWPELRYQLKNWIPTLSWRFGGSQELFNSSATIKVLK